MRSEEDILCIDAENDLGRFNHHPDAAIDFCIEVEALEAIAESTRLGLTGFGHEQDQANLDQRIERAMDFRVGGDELAVEAKQALRKVAEARGFDLQSPEAYAGQPIRRRALATHGDEGSK